MLPSHQRLHGYRLPLLLLSHQGFYKHGLRVGGSLDGKEHGLECKTHLHIGAALGQGRLCTYSSHLCSHKAINEGFSK